MPSLYFNHCHLEERVLAVAPSLRDLGELNRLVYSYFVLVYPLEVSVQHGFEYDIECRGRLDTGYTLACGWNCPRDWGRSTRHERSRLLQIIGSRTFRLGKNSRTE